MTLRLATSSDFDQVIRMARNFHQASPYSDLIFDEKKCEELWEQYLLGDRRSLIIILATDPEPFGMIIGLAHSLPFSNERVSMEVAWWVDHDKRGSKDSILLMKAYEDWSLRVGCKMTQMAMLDESSGHTDLQKFYLRQGYRPAERSFIKEVY